MCRQAATGEPKFTVCTAGSRKPENLPTLLALILAPTGIFILRSVEPRKKMKRLQASDSQGDIGMVPVASLWDYVQISNISQKIILFPKPIDTLIMQVS